MFGIVVNDLAASFEVPRSLVMNTFDRHRQGDFSEAERKLLVEIRARLCLQPDSRGVATSEGLLESMEKFFTGSRRRVLPEIAQVLGLRKERVGKKKITLAQPQRPGAVLGRTGNISDEYRNLLLGLRYIALCRETTLDDRSSDVA